MLTLIENFRSSIEQTSRKKRSSCVWGITNITERNDNKQMLIEFHMDQLSEVAFIEMRKYRTMLVCLFQAGFSFDIEQRWKQPNSHSSGGVDGEIFQGWRAPKRAHAASQKIIIIINVGKHIIKLFRSAASKQKIKFNQRLKFVWFR